MTTYWTFKLVHIFAVIASISLFAVRGMWMIAAPGNLQKRWVKIVPHVVDSVLLAAGIALVVLTRQYPFVAPWLSAKLLALVAYIVLGSLALKRARLQRNRILAFMAALACFAYMVSVALTRSPLPWSE